MFIHQIPSFVPSLFPKLTWQTQVEHGSRDVFFTFDDGPTPEITNFVLECLTTYSAKATFFCIGKNMVVEKGLVKSIQSNGHSLGNHTMNHANAWKYSRSEFEKDYFECSAIFKDLHIDSIGFRPPYGRVSSFINSIIKSAKLAIKPGCILVFHDSVKAFPRLKLVLPELLAYCNQENFNLKAL
jgi:peptidoglycan/xylan/chitin deacetylase (PgdA/CDA1 family)